MTRGTCNLARRRILSGSGGGDHLTACAACRAFADNLRAVDAALEATARIAAPLPGGLRARILAVSRTGPAPRLRGRALAFDGSLRAAAAAAILAAAAWAAPVPLFAADLDPLEPPVLPTFAVLDVSETLAEQIAALPGMAADPDVPETPDSLPFILGAASAVVGALGIGLARRNP